MSFLDPKIAELLKKKEEIGKQYDNVRLAISTLQEICEHEYVEDGHTSHETYYICKKCNKDKYV
jgi:hypothetical protein